MKTLWIVAAAALLAACGDTAPAPVVTVTEKAETPTSTSDLSLLALRLAWEQTTPSDQIDFCDAYTTYPNLTYAAFDESTDVDIPFTTFQRFFDDNC